MYRPPSKPFACLLLALAAFAAGAGCTHRVQVDPITVEPIYITLDINLKTDQKLDEFFGFQDEIEEELLGAGEGAGL